MWRRESIIFRGGAVAMSFGLKIVVEVLLLVGDSVSAGELPVNGFPTDADFFPIGRLGAITHSRANYKAIGINTFFAILQTKVD